MTKAELLKFLEPFADDIQIVGYNEEYSHIDKGLYEITPEYKVSKRYIDNLSIQEGDGYIVIH